ncbi:EndoU domain-containing protein [Pseudogracilibacillus auburnensis]|uniref:EndoU nuclease-like protein n=1 Tax=Pseudogracilibacillus auburnensis TaxID=1494959 RepID=A0A2V3W6W4_9BACI|nr:EndoU domain-containing protein [Pseudogracilibacillus auburnensis]MBO1003635.1 EndoU domain-containing protein [Pseudogracilibacillus auburnensis]PXW89326.1 EndoU nuclease-like protein [Pseudogracilibacillus auburnensis]
MFIKRSTIFLLTFTLFMLFGCDLEEGIENESTVIEINEVTAITDLEHTEYFRNLALEHILEGEINKKGAAVGFHYDRLPTKKGEVIEGTETKPNELGVYEAEVVVNHVEKTSNGGKSTFFPKDWDTQQVVDAINEAYESKEFISGNTYEGLTKEGMVIRMYVDEQEKIISAFPIY